jgi:hypothetical protein
LGGRLESAGQKLLENPVAGRLEGAALKMLGGLVSDALKSDEGREVPVVERSEVLRVLEKALAESPLFREEARRLSEEPKEATRRLSEIDARMMNDINEDASSLRRNASLAVPSVGIKEASALLQKLVDLKPEG